MEVSTRSDTDPEVVAYSESDEPITSCSFPWQSTGNIMYSASKCHQSDITNVWVVPVKTNFDVTYFIISLCVAAICRGTLDCARVSSAATL
jgi:hypothetical protein